MMKSAGKLLILIPITLLAAGLAWLGNVNAREQLNDRTAMAGELSLLYRFTGVTDDGEQGSANRRVATVIHCTNLETSHTRIEAQVYQWTGLQVYTGTVNLPPGQTLTFSTQSTALYFDDVILGGNPGTEAIFQGQGQIWTNSDNVICAVQILDPLNYPPSFSSGLPLYKMITGLDLTGPAAGAVFADTEFSATIRPSRADTPIVYTWEATDLPPLTQTSDTVDTAVFNWTEPGTKTITVTAVNAGSTISQSITIEVELGRVFLPYLVR